MQEATKGILCASMDLIPGVGPLLGKATGMLLDQFWPSGKNDVWEEIRKNVEKVVDQKLEAFYGKLMANELKGIHNLVSQYVRHAKSATSGGDVSKETARNSWRAAANLILSHMPKFQDEQYKYAVLPVFTQAANLHLLLLRDKAKNGLKIGFEPGEIRDARAELKKLAGVRGPLNWMQGVDKGGEYCVYAHNTYVNGVIRSLADSWFQSYAYQRQMFLAAFEYIPLWELMSDPDKEVKEVPRKVELILGPIGKPDGSLFDKWRGDYRHPIPAPPRYSRLGALRIWSQVYMIHGCQQYLGNGWQEIQGCTKGSDDEHGRGRGRGGGCCGFRPWAQAPGEYISKVWVRANSGSRGAVHTFQFQTSWGGKSHECGKGADSDNQKIEGFGIPGWEVSRIDILRHTGVYTKALAIGFRPVHDAWKPGNVKLPVVSGRSYNVVEASTSRLLDLDCFSLAPASGLVVREQADTRSQDWTLFADPSGAWTLVNHFSRLPLTVGGGEGNGGVVIGKRGSAGTAWSLDDNGDGTWSLVGDQGRLLSATTDGALIASTTGGGSRWVLLPAADPANETTDISPSLLTEHPVTDGQQSAADLYLVNPEGGESVPNWQLTFLLPTETGDFTITGGAQLHSRQDQERGVLVTVTASDPAGRNLEPGQEVAFTLTPQSAGSGARVVPDDVRLNSLRISG
ncbi:insecticidal delta-endotoxin Cry8Ea1 family protein [Streptomyces sp. KLMMK]|uniref:insecticidal delta-endotoxin Cry8Ea1 family protein n=1 Tax=Streptomyces sp. KLMMK TaxID=3109353 RepID=UPI002FFF8F82